MAAKKATGPIARFHRNVSSKGWRFAVSEFLFQTARFTSVGPANAADRSREAAHQARAEKMSRLTVKIQRLTARVEASKVKQERQRSKLEAMQAKLQTSRVKLDGYSTRLENLKRGPLFVYDVAALTHTVCPVCDDTRLHVLPYPHSTNPSFSRLIVLLCSACGFGWVPALPFDLDAYYRTEYASSNRKDRGFSPEEYFSPTSRLQAPDGPLSHYFQRSHEQLDLIRPYKDPIGTMLDFGSGPGYALHVSKATEKHAIEPDDASQKYLDYLGARRLDFADLQPQSYDVILASHSIEHVPASRAFETLGRLRDALRSDGVLCIEVPNASLGSVHSTARHEPHTLFFSPVSLVKLCERAGFQVLFQVARVKLDRPRLPEPLTPPSDDAWASTTDEGLCLILRRSGTMPQRPSSPSPVGSRVLAPV